MMAKVPTAANGERLPVSPAVGLDRGLFVRPIAHRGLHNKSRGLIENTAPAFLAAIDQDYGIECDLQPARDGTPMVFHDATLDRLMAARGRIAARSPQELSRLRYKGQDIAMLSFEELLRLIDGRVPLLAEIKGRNRQPRGFLGAIAIAKLGPLVPRGIVVGCHQLGANWGLRASAAKEHAAVAALFAKAPPNLSFYAVEVRMLAAAKAWVAQHAPTAVVFTWTVRTAKERALAARWADAPIFEATAPARAEAMS